MFFGALDTRRMQPHEYIHLGFPKTHIRICQDVVIDEERPSIRDPWLRRHAKGSWRWRRPTSCARHRGESRRERLEKLVVSYHGQTCGPFTPPGACVLLTFHRLGREEVIFHYLDTFRHVVNQPQRKW